MELSNIIPMNDENLNLDPYFDERKKELHQIRFDIKNDNMEMLFDKQYTQEIEEFFNTIENQS